MKNFKVKKLVALVSISIVGGLSGCATTLDANKTYLQERDHTKTMLDSAKPVSAISLEDQEQDNMANFGHVKKNWVNPTPLLRNNTEIERSRLPSFFKKQISLTLPGQVSVVEILSELQRSSNVRVTLNQDIYDVTKGEASIVGASTANTAKPVPVSVSDFVFRGTLEDGLDLLASKANISWKWTGSNIELYKFETKSYNITLLAGKTVANSEVSLQSETTSAGGTGTSSGAGTTGSNSKQGVTRTATLDSWGDVKNYLISLMSAQGSIAIMESTGLVTIRDTHENQEKLAKAISDLNALIGQQIYINVDVYAVTKDAADDYGLDWNIAWNSLRNSAGYITSSGSTASNKLNVGVLTGPFSGSSVVVQALSKLGKASIVNQFQITTLNGQPTPIGNVKKIPYISGVSSTPSTVAGQPPTYTMETSSVFQGINMSITPKVQPNGKILLEYAMNLSDFQGFTTLTTGSGSSAQSLSLPTTTLKNILQRASLRSGQALVLSGFKQTIASTTNSGVGSPDNIVLGGARAAQKQEQYLVITVTPYVAQDND